MPVNYAALTESQRAAYRARERQRYWESFSAEERRERMKRRDPHIAVRAEMRGKMRRMTKTERVHCLAGQLIEELRELRDQAKGPRRKAVNEWVSAVHGIKDEALDWVISERAAEEKRNGAWVKTFGDGSDAR